MSGKAISGYIYRNNEWIEIGRADPAYPEASTECIQSFVEKMTLFLADDKWAMSWENLFMPCANNKDADQSTHPRSLISVFVIRFLDSIISIDAVS